MRRDDHLIIEALQSKFTGPQGVETHVLNELNKMVRYLESLSTAIHLSKSSAVDQLLSRVRDTAEMLMSERGSGTSENTEEEGELMTHMKQQGMIAKDAKVTLPRHETEEAENASAFHYDPMPGLAKAAAQIREILQGAANDEARTEHVIKMAQIILGDPKEHAAAEYRKMLDGLIVTLNRFVVVPMNEYEEQGGETLEIPIEIGGTGTGNALSLNPKTASSGGAQYSPLMQGFKLQSTSTTVNPAVKGNVPHVEKPW